MADLTKEQEDQLNKLHGNRNLTRLIIQVIDRMANGEVVTIMEGMAPTDLDKLANQRPGESITWTPEEIAEFTKDDAMKHYKKELAKIDQKIAEITGKPPPVVVQLKTARLLGKPGRLEM